MMLITGRVILERCASTAVRNVAGHDSPGAIRCASFVYVSSVWDLRHRGATRPLLLTQQPTQEEE